MEPTCGPGGPAYAVAVHLPGHEIEEHCPVILTRIAGNVAQGAGAARLWRTPQLAAQQFPMYVERTGQLARTFAVAGPAGSASER